MKIEIAENLVYSYLKHIEGCRIVQTNWKTSGKWIVTEYDDKLSKELFNKIQSSPIFNGIFKKNSFGQLIKQAEIDVVGLNTTENSIFGIDVAFHGKGLNYGSNDETALKIMKKIFRTILIMQSYFNSFDKFSSLFVTPKVTPATLNPILDLMSEAKNLINDEMIEIDFIANENFFTQIVNPVVETLSDENDLGELFARAINLIQMNPLKKNNLHKNKIESIDKNDDVIDQSNTKQTHKGMKIGQFVQYTMRKIHEQNLLSQEEINNLKIKEYSNKVFKLNSALLRNIDEGIKGPKGRNRYYAKEYFLEKYLLTSQWNEKHWDDYFSWLHKIGYKIENIL